MTSVIAAPARAGATTSATGSLAWPLVDAVCLLVLAVVAAVPRTVNLLGLDPFIDEVAWVDWAVRQFEWSAPRSWLIPVLTDGRPPLFVWLTAALALVVDNGFLAGRLISAGAGVLSALLLYLLGRELATRTVGLVAGLLWALTPFSIQFSRVAADDMLLTLTAVLVTWASVRLARRPTLAAGAFCGAALGVAALSKTNGVLLAFVPLLALVLLGRPGQWNAYLRPFAVAVLAGLAVSWPLLLGIGPLYQQAALHTGGKGNDDSGLLAANLSLSAYWLDVLVGYRLAALALAGGLLALMLRQWGLVFAGLVGAALLAIMLAITSPLFSRYLLFGAFPFFLLAGFAVERAGWLVGQGIARVARSGPLIGRGALAAYAAVLVVGMAAVVAERGQLAADLVLDPSRAALPDTERFRYVEQWFAAYGLGQMVEELRARAADGSVTLLAPPASRENRVLLPHSALRFYLRGDSRVRIVDAPPLYRAQNLRELRRDVREGPTYLVVNGSYTPAPGMPDEIPQYTRQLERRLARDLPDAHEVLRIPRPSAPNWLSLYRLDADD